MKIIFWLLVSLISLIMGYWVYRADKKRGVAYAWLIATLRTIVIFLTCLLLLTPLLNIHKNEAQKPIILFLQDNSESISKVLKDDSSAYRKEAIKLLNKFGKDYRVIKWGFGDLIRRDTLFDYKEQITNISQAISQAVEYYDQQNLGAIILATDGRFNQGENPQLQNLSYQGNLYTVAIGDSTTQKDLRVVRIYANKTVALNSQFEIRADVLANLCGGQIVNAQLREINGATTGNVSINIPGDHFDRTVSFTVKADKTGLHHYVVSTSPLEGEQNTINNRMDVFVEVVSEKKNILIAAAAPHPDINAIKEALTGLENYTLTIRTAENVPLDLSPYQILILHSLPAISNKLPQLSSIKKPTWFITGAGTDIATINLTQIAGLNTNSLNLQNSFAQYNGSFTSFTLPQQLNAVMDKMPPLSTPGGAISENPSSSILLSSKSNKQPLWLLQQGAPAKALLAGEGLWRWRMYEYRYFSSHNIIDEMIRQTVSFLSANVNENPFRTELSKYIWSDRENISLNAYLLNSNNEQINNVDVQLVIMDSTGKKSNYNFEKSGSAYRLNIGIRASGIYHYIAKTIYNGKALSSSGTFTVQHTSLEMMETGTDYPMLHGLARKYGGSLVPARKISTLYDSIILNKNISSVIKSTDETIPLIDWKWFFFLILLAAIAEWILRKYWMAQ